MNIYAVYLDKDNMRFLRGDKVESLFSQIRKLGYDPATVTIKKCPVK